MWHLITGTDNWADEMDVDFFDILDEDDYKKYMIAKEVLGSFLEDLYIGSNECIEDFDYLQFEPKDITQEDFNTLVRLGLVDKNNRTYIGFTVFENFMEMLAQELEYQGIEYDNLWDTTPEEFRSLCEQLQDIYS